MKIEVKSKSLELNSKFVDYVEEKISKMAKFFNKIPSCVVHLEKFKGEYKAEITLDVAGKIVRAVGNGPDITSAIDFAHEKLEQQVKKFKEKLKERKFLQKEEIFSEIYNIEHEAETEKAMIVKRKRFELKAMDEEEALLQMELLGHDFFVFLNVENGRVNVIYKRKDGDFGLIEPIY